MEFFKEKHDELMENMPEGVSHDAANCMFCNPSATASADASPENNSIEGGDMKTYTEDEFTAAVAAAVSEAVSPLQAELAEVRTSQAEEEIASRIASAVAEVEVRVSELQLELDGATLRATSAEEAFDNLVEYLKGEVAAAEEAALHETRRSERRESIKEVASFTDEYLDANLDRWVAMDDEAFAAVLEDWKAIPSKSDSAKREINSQVPAETAMKNIRSTEGNSASKTVLGARSAGIDIRKLY